jgi:hypothetical protein
MRSATATIVLLLAASVIAWTGGRSVRATPPGAGTPPQAWPRVFEEAALTVVFYEPQVESWDRAQLVARAAVSIETAASPEPHFGTVWIAAHTHVFKEDHVVVLEDAKLTRATFPTAPGRADEWLAVLRRHLPDVRVWELDRPEASLAATEIREAKPGEPQATRGGKSPPATLSLALENEPPEILFATRPALLVLVDGPAVERRVPGTGWQRIVNTRALLLVREGVAPGFFLAIDRRWLAAPALEGPWTLASSVPEGADAAKKLATDAKLVDLHENDAEVMDLLRAGDTPEVFVRTRPAELIVTSGEPRFVPIAGTSLLWANNTDADIFIDSNTGLTYVLLGGRWFRAPSRAGPWSYVPAFALPADFARIPERDPAGEVLASVPGTPEAQEAVIVNGIPETAEIDRRRARLFVAYDGDPRFEPIAGTSLAYALNTRTPVIRVDDRYYACEDGVWFTGSSPFGPWVVASTVPPPIYEIPPSCPIHSVTYCRVYDVGSDWVCFGYTPGYFGCYISDGCVVWGAGRWWRPWIGRQWFGRPWTYGFSVGVRWGFRWGSGVGMGLGARPFCAPWWAPLDRPHPAFYPLVGERAVFHLDVRNANVYGAWPRTVVHSRESLVARSPTRGALPNNVYSAADGRVYRRTEGVWERREAFGWGRWATGLEGDYTARAQGATRSFQRRTVSEFPSHIYRPMLPQHSFGAPEQPRSVPQPIPPGLVEGFSGHTRGGR